MFVPGSGKRLGCLPRPVLELVRGHASRYTDGRVVLLVNGGGVWVQQAVGAAVGSLLGGSSGWWELDVGVRVDCGAQSCAFSQDMFCRLGAAGMLTLLCVLPWGLWQLFWRWEAMSWRACCGFCCGGGELGCVSGRPKWVSRDELALAQRA